MVHQDHSCSNSFSDPNTSRDDDDTVVVSEVADSSETVLVSIHT